MAGRSKSIGGIARSNTAKNEARTGGNEKNSQAQSNQGSTASSTKGKSKGIVALLSGKKGRGKSPASQRRYPEGVLGKDGARVWLKE